MKAKKKDSNKRFILVSIVIVLIMAMLVGSLSFITKGFDNWSVFSKTKNVLLTLKYTDFERYEVESYNGTDSNLIYIYIYKVNTTYNISNYNSVSTKISFRRRDMNYSSKILPYTYQHGIYDNSYYCMSVNNNNDNYPTFVLLENIDAMFSHTSNNIPQYYYSPGKTMLIVAYQEELKELEKDFSITFYIKGDLV